MFPPLVILPIFTVSGSNCFFPTLSCSESSVLYHLRPAAYFLQGRKSLLHFVPSLSHCLEIFNISKTRRNIYEAHRTKTGETVLSPGWAGYRLDVMRSTTRLTNSPTFIFFPECKFIPFHAKNQNCFQELFAQTPFLGSVQGGFCPRDVKTTTISATITIGKTFHPVSALRGSRSSGFIHF